MPEESITKRFQTLSKQTPVTIGLVIVLLGAMAAVFGWVSSKESAMASRVAQYTKDTNAKLETIKEAVQGLRTELALMRKNQERIADLRIDLKEHKLSPGHPELRRQVAVNERRLTSLEQQVQLLWRKNSEKKK